MRPTDKELAELLRWKIINLAENGNMITLRAVCEQAADALSQPAPPVSQVLANRLKDRNYAPYCLRCDTMVRMTEMEPFYWRCQVRNCGAIHDERMNVPAQPAPTFEERVTLAENAIAREHEYEGAPGPMPLTYRTCAEVALRAAGLTPEGR